LASQNGSIFVGGNITANSAGGSSTSVGPTISLSAPQSVFVNGSLLANGGVGLGGTVTVSESSSATTAGFIVGATATSTTGGVTGNIDVRGNSLGAGTINITNNSGSLTITPSQILASSISGNGGLVSLTAAQVLSFPAGGTLNVSGSTLGGSVDMSAQSLSIAGGPLNIQANGLGTSASGGGSVGGNFSQGGFTLGNVSNGLTISAAGLKTGGNVSFNVAGPVNTVGASSLNVLNVQGEGATGSFSVITTGTFTTDSSGIAVNGQATFASEGGTLKITANGLYINGPISATGSLTAIGGTVGLVSNSALPFLIGGTLIPGTNQGIASGATVTVYGGNSPNSLSGSISVSANNATSMTVNTPALLQATGAPGNGTVGAVGGGSGGSITLTALAGALNFTSGALSVNGTNVSTGSQPNTTSFNGGTINLSANSISSSGTTTISANGAGTGNGGAITMNASGSALTLGTNILVQALGGSVSGNGGTLTATAGQSLTLGSLSGIQLNPTGANGNGGGLILSSGIKAPSNLVLASALVEDGVGSGSGGIISLTATGYVHVGGVATNSLEAIGGATGSGGQISVVSGTTAPFVVGGGNGLGATSPGTYGNIDADGGIVSGGGGSISLTSSPGGFSLAAGSIVTASAQINGAGGKISFTNTGAGGTFTYVGSTINANALGTSALAGGSITIATTSLTPAGTPTGPLFLNANGANKGAGGTVTVSTSTAGSAFTVGTAAGMLDITAEDGGTVNLTSAGSMLVNINGLNTICIACTKPTVSLSTLAGNLTINGPGVLNVVSPQGGTLNLNVNGGALTETNGATIAGLWKCRCCGQSLPGKHIATQYQYNGQRYSQLAWSCGARQCHRQWFQLDRWNRNGTKPASRQHHYYRYRECSNACVEFPGWWFDQCKLFC
jgi:hypothetical protein